MHFLCTYTSAQFWLSTIFGNKISSDYWQRVPPMICLHFIMFKNLIEFLKYIIFSAAKNHQVDFILVFVTPEIKNWVWKISQGLTCSTFFKNWVLIVAVKGWKLFNFPTASTHNMFYYHFKLISKQIKSDDKNNKLRCPCPHSQDFHCVSWVEYLNGCTILRVPLENKAS